MKGAGVGERIRGSVVLSLALLASGCGLHNAEMAFATDFNCPEATATSTGANGRYRVHGCGRTAIYVCQEDARGLCGLQTASGEPRESDDARSSAPEPAQAPSAKVRLESTDDDDAHLTTEIRISDRALLRLTAAPEAKADVVQIKLVQRDDNLKYDKCVLEAMVNGQVLSLPETHVSRNRLVVQHRVLIGKELIADFGTAERVGFRVCKERFALTTEQVYQVREFVDRFEQAVAWSGAPKQGDNGGMTTPTGGWPAWSAGAATLTALPGPALDPRELFKKLSPSIFVLEASRGDGTSQGSAVAVSKTELLTNCHVVQGALKLQLKQNKQEWPVTLVRADPKTDRCVVQVSGTELQPIAGLRSYASLEVGEPAYTLGSPVGLELTLSNGIVSGRREEDHRQFVQTTAPISPGSSGGGLFDARGNLIGITTLVLAGKQRLNQALNFAIPADAFWEP